eukprot:153913-Prorocentrum_minimum.AAC.1
MPSTAPAAMRMWAAAMQAGAHVGGVVVADSKEASGATSPLPELAGFERLPAFPLPPFKGDWGAVTAALPADLEARTAD